uniref:Uncharacterized protein n=1 Tax=Anguilla anguilla TaxID=7936 RepID=A0A0E9UKR1_ANGAN
MFLFYSYHTGRVSLQLASLFICMTLGLFVCKVAFKNGSVMLHNNCTCAMLPAV